MYRWMRNSHLFLGLFSFLSVLVYGVSSVRMSHRTWLAVQPEVSETHLTVPAETGANPRVLARFLMDQRGMRGDVNQDRMTPSGSYFRLAMPGTNHEVTYAKDTGDVKIVTRKTNFVGMLVAIHEQGGFWHDEPIRNVWGALVAVVSASLIVLALTGIYLWFKIHKERLIGIILLAISLGYSLTLMVLLRTA
jgi:hypothetical protein